MLIRANCCKVSLIRVDQCKVKMGVLKQKSGRTRLDWQNIICRTKFAYFRVQLFHITYSPIVYILLHKFKQSLQRYILMFMFCLTWFLYDQLKRPKLNNQKWKEQGGFERDNYKSIEVGVWVQGWPLLTEISSVNRRGRWKWGGTLPYSIFI